MIDDIGNMQHIGQRFGNYRLLQFLGLNRKASIYLGEHVHLQTRAIIQLYQLRLLHDDQRNFLDELRIIAHLIHPHIVRVLEFGVEHDTPFLVLSYAAGGPFRYRYPVGAPLPWPVLLSYVNQIASALDYAHSERVQHLDLRPENMWIGSNGEVLLSDFRITLFSYGSRSESIRDIAAAMAYMAPEQIRGQPSAASDQYALGAVVYEWLCGFCPFSGTDYLTIASQQLYTSPPSLVERVQNLSLAVERVVMQALAKDSTQRFPSVQAFAAALEQSYRTPEHVSQYSINLPGSLPTMSPLEHLSPSSEHAKKRLSRRTMAAGVAGLIGVATVGGGLTWFFRSLSTQKPPNLPETAPTGTTFYTCRKHVDSVYGVAWSRDGQRIASWSRDDTMQTWNTATGSPLQTYSATRVLSWSPDWHYMVSGDIINGFQIWELATGRTLVTHDVMFTGAGDSGERPVNFYAEWAPDNKHVVTTFDSTQVWDMPTGKPLFSYPTGAVAWSPDGTRLAMVATDYTGKIKPLKLQILEVATENTVISYPLPVSINSPYQTRLFWSPNGNYLAAGTGQVWHAATGKLVSTYQKPYGSLVWSPDSRYLAWFDDAQQGSQYLDMQRGIKADSTVRIWNALTGKNVFVYRGHTAGVNDVAWSPDGTKIASASADLTVKVWQAPS